jgi:23S rRNA pseudouridine1911/1915/1917 synthase
MPVFSGTVEVSGGLRLDRYVSEHLGLLSRSQIRSRSMSAMVNGKAVKRSRILKLGDHLELSWEAADSGDLLPEDLPLTVLYEDPQVIVINKAQGMVVHPGAGNYRGTLANALLFRHLNRLPESAGALLPGDPCRPGIVHRLDKDTSGVMICAWDAESHAVLSEEFKSRQVRKCYAAIIRGTPKELSGRIETLLCRDSRDRKRFTVGKFTVGEFAGRGRNALTYYRVIRSWGTHSLVLLRPRTGRTHQLRVHMAYLGHPITGDPIYGSPDPLFPQATLMLHARTLRLMLPGETTARTFKAPLPDRFRQMIRALDSKAAKAAALP